MGTIINRRRVCGSKKGYLPGYTLIYHWEAADGIVNGGWVDRVQGYRLIRTGNPQLVNGMMKVNEDNIFSNNHKNLVLTADVWQIDVEFKIDSLPSDNKNMWLVDFNSV